jgi:hypothetical protein
MLPVRSASDDIWEKIVGGIDRSRVAVRGLGTGEPGMPATVRRTGDVVGTPW